MVADFGARHSDGAIVVLTGVDGHVLPARTAVRTGAEAAGLVGFDGETWITGLAPHNTLAARLPNGGTCHASFDYSRSKDSQPRIGPVPCRSNLTVDGCATRQ